MNLISDFQPGGWRDIKGYGKTEHFDPKKTGKWDQQKSHRYARSLLNGWLLIIGGVLLLAAMAWNSWKCREFCFGPAVPLLFGIYLVRRTSDSSFAQSGRIISGIFILYAWKNVLYALIAVTNAAAVRTIAGGLTWIGMAVTGIMLALSMYDTKHEMQSGFVCAADLVAMAALWFACLRNITDLTLLYFLMAAMAAAAVLNFLITIPAVLIKYKAERGNFGRYLAHFAIGCVPLLAGYYLSNHLSALVTGLLVIALYAAAGLVSMWPGSVMRLERRALTAPLFALLSFDYGWAFWCARKGSTSLAGALKFFHRLSDFRFAFPESKILGIKNICTALRAVLLLPVKAVNSAVSVPAWMLSADGSWEGFQCYALNQVYVYLVLMLLITLCVEASMHLQLPKRNK